VTCMRVSLITLGDPDKLTGGYLYHRRLAARAAHHGATVEFVSVPERPFAAAVVAGRGALARAAAADVTVLDSIAAAFVAPWLRFHRTPPLVAVLHQPPGGVDSGAPRRFVQARLDARAYRRARMLIAASQTLVRDLEDSGLGSLEVTVVAPGRDVAPSAHPPGEDLRRGRRAAVLCVGNWVERKGVVMLLEAVARLPSDLATLHLVGDTGVDPRYTARVRTLLKQPELSRRVAVHGSMARERVAGMYEAADVFALPSTREPYGTALGEAMAAGLPLVGVDAGNLPYLVENGVEGLVVPVGDVDALTGALARLCSDPVTRARMGEAALKRAASLPTWDDTADRFFGTLRRVAGGSPA
jgi:glycosyltransferase involved in cell wall biosynthesis